MIFKILHNVRIYSLLFLLGISFFSCTKKKLEATIPAYISIDKISFTTDPSTQGSNSENITDAWVYINDNLVGVYELPVTFPVLKEGNFKLEIFAGIKDNGISASRVRYPFYKGYVEQINLVKNKTIYIHPQVTYYSNTKFAWLEDFESAGLSFTYTNGSDTVVNKTSTNVFEGIGSGKVYLTDIMDFFEAKSPLISGTTLNGNDAYLELNFKTNEPLLIGIYADNDQVGLVNLNTTTIWKKIYINLTNVIKSKPNTNNFQLFFGLKETFTNKFSVSNPEFLLDNIKLVHF